MIHELLLKLFFGKDILAHTDCDWLRIVYRKMDKSKSIPRDCCSMHGIRCNTYGHIKEIDWSNQDLSGSIPSEIGMFVQLESL
jgi:hypothetical protein